jgi:Ca-activated chloride channel family protein
MRFLNEEWLWALLLLLPLGLLYFQAARARRRDLSALGELQVLEKLVPGHRPRRRVLKAVLQLAGLAFLALTLARPQFGTRVELAKREGQDLMIAVDTSSSMLAEDMKPNRLARASIFVQQLLERLQGDRVGLISFAGDAFVHCPLTTDYGAARIFLEEALSGINPTRGTDLAQAVRVGVSAFPQEDEPGHRMLLLLTDGEDHGGKAVSAAEDAARQGVRIDVVGFGALGGQPIPLYDERGDKAGFKKDKNGEVVRTQLDEETLREVARVTRGTYCRASADQDCIDGLLQELSGMGSREIEEQRVTVYEDRFQYPLMLSLCCLITDAFISTRAGQRRRRRQGSVA